MNQSAVIGGSLIAGFVLFLMAQDKLPTYARVLWGDKPASHNPADAGTSPTQGIIPGTDDDFDPLDVMGDYGVGLGDALKALDGYFK